MYLLDFNSLGARISDNDWRKLVSDYFANSKTMILGYGLRSDFSILARTNRAFVGLENK